MFSGKKILFGVSGGIAAYKAALFVRTLRKEHADVKVVMTQSATHFVGPLTFRTLSMHEVVLDLFAPEQESATIHIDIARWADCILVCPATANIIAKIANGIADDALTTIVAASTAPLILCPAMNKEMYANPIFKANQKRLLELGTVVVEPSQGELACGEEGWGRLADETEIVDSLKKVLLGSNDLTGLQVLVTAARTEEEIDPVRFLTNAATGKMGFALAEVAALRGADVTLITGPTSERAFAGIQIRSVRSAAQMSVAVKREINAADVLIMAAAVADFRPVVTKSDKVKKTDMQGQWLFEPTEDILQSVGKSKGKRIHVGFAVETQNEIRNAQKKLQSKNLDLVVVNNPLREGAGFATDTNIVTLLNRNGKIIELPLMTKREVAARILDEVKELL